jgi:hypothetical protein
MLFAAWVFGAGRLERWVRGLFVAAGVIFPLELAYGLGLLPMWIALPVVLVWVVAAPLACSLLAMLFWRRSIRSASQ